MAEENKATVSACSGGYNRGWEVIASRHLELIGLAKRVARRHNMALIFLSHTDIRKQKLNPDVEEHTVWDLMMPPNAANHYARLCDAILFIREEAFVRGAEKDDKTGKVTKPGKIIRTGNRIIMCGSEGHQGFTKAKNRMNLDSKIPVPFGTNPLLDLIPYYVAQNA